jgi:L-ectoine synthase
VIAEGWESTRLLLAADKMGFSFHITTIYAGAELALHYQHHLESVYCISGEGEVQNLQDGKTHLIVPGVIYILDQHDKHVLRARSQMKMACVFNPPLYGSETHDASGAYPAGAVDQAVN